MREVLSSGGRFVISRWERGDQMPTMPDFLLT
jgi:hypothetical protein